MLNLLLCHWSSQLFDLHAPLSTDVPVLLLNQPNIKKTTTTTQWFLHWSVLILNACIYASSTWNLIVQHILMIKMVLFVQGLIGTVKAIASEVCDNTNQVDSDKCSTSWTYFKPRHAIFHTHFQSCSQFANPLSCPFSISQRTFQAVLFI